MSMDKKTLEQLIRDNIRFKAEACGMPQVNVSELAEIILALDNTEKECKKSTISPEEQEIYDNLPEGSLAMRQSLFLERVGKLKAKPSPKVEKPFPVSACCSAGAKAIEMEDEDGYVCTNCGRHCELTEWSKPKKVEVPEEMSFSCPGVYSDIQLNRAVHKINQIIEYLRVHDKEK